MLTKISLTNFYITGQTFRSLVSDFLSQPSIRVNDDKIMEAIKKLHIYIYRQDITEKN